VAGAEVVGVGVGEVVASGGIVSLDSAGGVTSPAGFTGCIGISGPKEMPTTTMTTTAITKRTAKTDLRLL